MADHPDVTAGPLVVSATNPRYFTVAGRAGEEEKVVYLTGSHFNNNFHAGLGPGAECAAEPEPFDYRAYLAFLKRYGHNFIRLWRWEHFISEVGGDTYHFCAAPQPWPRVGPGAARDGKPKFDLSQFDPTYFQRLREYIVAAGEAGIYVSIMLFEGFPFHLSPPPYNVEGHPFHSANNLNGIGISSIVDCQVLPLEPRIQALQEAYMRKVVDSVHDLPNVLYEVSNESSGVDADSIEFPGGSSIPARCGDTTQWQYWVIDFIKAYERELGTPGRPVGMTMQFPVPDQTRANDVLFNSPADWISPGFDEPIEVDPQGGGPVPGRWFTNPPAADGRKVILSDTDHYAAFRSDPLWAWKSFLRGHNPLLYDFGINPSESSRASAEGTPPDDSFEATRYAMGDTLRFANKINLVEMEPLGDLSSTGYALANPEQEYLVLRPGESTDPFTLAILPGTYLVEWYSIRSRMKVSTGEQTVADKRHIRFAAPFGEAGPAVLYLKRVEG